MTCTHMHLKAHLAYNRLKEPKLLLIIYMPALLIYSEIAEGKPTTSLDVLSCLSVFLIPVSSVNVEMVVTGVQ